MAKSKKTIVASVGLAAGKSTVIGSARAFKQPPDEHQIYNLVGRVAANWANLEHILDITIWKLAKVPGSRGACLTAQMMGVMPRFNAIEALLTQSSGKLPAMQEFISPMRSLSQACIDASMKRNRIFHYSWHADEQGEIARFLSMPRGELVYGLKDEDRERILGLIEKIKRLSDQAEYLRDKIFSQLDA